MIVVPFSTARGGLACFCDLLDEAARRRAAANAFLFDRLRRYNEALALDYIIPFRVITPEAAAAP